MAKKTWKRAKLLVDKSGFSKRWFNDHYHDPDFPEVRYAGISPMMAEEDWDHYLATRPRVPQIRNGEPVDGEPVKRPRGRPRKQTADTDATVAAE